uniref:Uncharacterized protein n=1 Tax=Chromera velia CCMP2878 TaxID=1169474 RepID=A0A0G4GH17_9ALVE|eukprot:Cvel_4692.t1-p1 / transcript=Cvel_4692.t1 / gene=Cvel_4692 / organism=Chromera_velia_CCMP2878 / gene_product=hypothetical protein / transcript_product=hypothetical protein / location=Cvel_scaffold208:87478-90478(-) / protein_length=93 / sequence_SO=supercontig / SO=protein_coding / is_pseudo=false
MDADMLWSHQQEMQRKQLVAVERGELAETYRQRQRGEEATVQTNFSLSADQKGAQNILKTKVYTNDPSDDYFNYFGHQRRLVSGEDEGIVEEE